MITFMVFTHFEFLMAFFSWRFFMHKNKKTATLAAAGIMAALLLGCGAQSSPVENPKAPEATEPSLYDLTDQNLTYEEYQAFCQEHPGAEVIWMIPFQGTQYSPDTTQLTISSLTEEEARLLALFPNLTQIDASKCTDPKALMMMKEALPQCQVLCQVTLGGNTYSSDITELELSDVPAQEISQALPLLTELKTVSISGLSDQELKNFITQFPDVFFKCELEYDGKSYSTDSTELDLSGIPFTEKEVEDLLSFFPKLEKLVVCDCGLGDETLEALNLSHPDTRIVWSMQIGKVLVRTDDIYFFPAGISESGLPDNEAVKRLRFCHDIVAVDLGHSKVSEIEWVEGMPHLKYLILADSYVTDISPLSSLKELLYLELFRVNVTDYSPLLGCTALQDLNIGCTHGDPTPLTQMTWLHNLKWNRGADDPETRDLVLQLPELLPDTNVWIIDDGLNIGRPWRFLPNYYIFREIIQWTFFNQEEISNYWGKDSGKIMSCSNRERFAGDVLAEIIRYRIDNGIPMFCVKNLDSEKAEILYQTMLNSRPASWPAKKES